MDFVSVVSGILLCVIGVGATVLLTAILFKEKTQKASHPSGAGSLSEKVPAPS